MTRGESKRQVDSENEGRHCHAILSNAWFSTRINAIDMTPTGILSGINASAGDQLKSGSDFSQYDPASGAWVGLNQISNTESYRVSLAQGGTLFVVGAQVDDTIKIPWQNGWNWIGYPIAETLEVNRALGNFTSAKSNDVLKDQYDFAQYVQGRGWVGSLTHMIPGRGYKLNAHDTSHSTFQYYPPNPALAPPTLTAVRPGTLPPIAVSRNEKPGSARGTARTTTGLAAAPQWHVDPAQFAYDMTVTAVIRIDGVESLDESNILGAFVDSTCRGVASVYYVNGLKKYEFFLMIHSNAIAGETVTFKVYDAANDRILPVNESITFEADGSHGTLLSPVTLGADLVAGVNDATRLPERFALGQNFPNPFNPSTTVQYELPVESRMTITIYSVLGQQVATLVDGIQPAGTHTAAFNSSGIASGIYFYKMSATGVAEPSKRFTAIRRMLLIK